jgi:hypothetical protein
MQRTLLLLLLLFMLLQLLLPCGRGRMFCASSSNVNVTQLRCPIDWDVWMEETRRNNNAMFVGEKKIVADSTANSFRQTRIRTPCAHGMHGVGSACSHRPDDSTERDCWPRYAPPAQSIL